MHNKYVERVWRKEGLKVAKKWPKRTWLWSNDGSCIRLQPTHVYRVWSYNFAANRTSDGRSIGMLTIVDEVTEEWQR